MGEALSEPATLDSVIVRFGGELWLKKAWTKRRYVRCLVRNMKHVLKHHNVEHSEVMRRHGRLFLRTREVAEASSHISRVFGVGSVSPALEVCSNRLEDIVDKSVLLAGDLLGEGNSFAVRCRRVGKHTYGSGDVCRQVGQRVLKELGEYRNLTVDLKHPDIVLGVEVRDNEAFVFNETVKGVGGMPLGTQDRVICILNGDIDSAVAGWLVMKRGCPLVPLYFDCGSCSEEIAGKSALKTAEALLDWAVGFPRWFYSVHYGHVLESIVKNCPSPLTCLLCKRMKYRVAEQIAELKRAEGIVTGETIGEQTSLTIQNLRVLDDAAKRFPVHRPLLGFDKAETERMARKIGTYKTSARSVLGCKAIPHKPATKAKLEEIFKAEAELNINEMTERCLEELEVVGL
ncbi:MAG: tRNA sulfurtransferase [Candidatus Bathyarchaeota archaeon]|nr:MAG: tRNA sulfurtransferase [Candidatus Bathyarchaeota archaeon]